MELSTLYWVLILPKLAQSIAVICIISITVLGVGGMLFAVIEQEKIGKTVAIWTFSTCAPLLIITAFIPNEKQMMYLIGGYVATNTEGVEKLPKNVVDAANRFLEDYTEKK